jgi:MoxR-like ATPase
MDPDIEQYIVDLTTRTRQHRQVAVGASPRGGLALLKLSRAHAAMQGRSYTLPDDVKLFCQSALCHRLILEPDLWTVRKAVDDVVTEIVKAVPVPVIQGI